MSADNEKSTPTQHRLVAFIRANAWLIAALILATGVAFWVQWPNLSDPYTVQDDFRIFYWLHRYADPGLFPNEGQILYTIRHIDLGFAALDIDVTSPLYSLIFLVTSPFLPINLTSKLLVFPLILISVYFLYRIGSRGGRPGTGFALATIFAILNLTSADTISVVSGLQRSFAMPIILAIVYSLMARRYWLAAIALAIGGLIYPPIMLLGLLTYLPSLFDLQFRPFGFKIHWRRAYPLLVLAGLAAVLLLPALSTQTWRIDFEAIARLDGLQRLLSEPNYQPDGGYPLFDPLLGILVGRAGIFTRIEMLWWAVTFGLASLAFIILRPASWRAFPGPLKHLLWAGFIGYGLAWLAVVMTGGFILYLPNRYTRVSVFLAPLAFLVMSAEQVILNALGRLKQLGKRTIWLPFLAAAGTSLVVLWLIENHVYARLSTTKIVGLTWNVALAAGLFAGALALRLLGRGKPADDLHPDGGLRLRRWQWALIGALLLVPSWPYINHTEGKDMYFTMDENSKDVMDFLESLPVESQIMGHPCDMNQVPLLAKRSVLWSCKQPPSGRPELREDTTEAYYADSLVEVYDFCQQYDVDYMVVNREVFQEGEQYALLEVPGELKIYENEDQFVMPCRPPAGETDIPPELAQMEEANLVWRAIDPKVIQQGANADLHLYWENLDPGADTPQLCLSLISEQGEATDPTCMPLSPAEDIRQLGDDTFAFMTYELEVSPYLDGGSYQVLAEVFSPDDSSGEPVTGVVGEIDFKAGQRQFARQEDQEAGQSIASWDDQIALTDADVVKLDDHSLEIDLRWQALARMNNSNKVFVHLVGTNGSGLVAQVDAVPRNWTYPTNWWEKGEIVTDTLSIPLDGIGPGSYQVWLGLYDEVSLERLPLDDSPPSDDPTYQNAIKIAELEL